MSGRPPSPASPRARARGRAPARSLTPPASARAGGAAARASTPPPPGAPRADRRAPPGRVERALKADISRLFLRDQALFTAGVANALLAAAWLARAPRSFPLAFLAALPPVLAWLAFSFAVRKWWAFFLADFCYFANALAWAFFARAAARGAFAGGAAAAAAALPPPARDGAFAAVFALATGPLLLANVPWRVSLIPHSPDKMCSLFVHAAAPLAAWAWRWHGGGGARGAPVGARELLAAPLVAYAAWQAGYLLLTEVACARALRREPRYSTSLRHLVAVANRGGACLRAARALGAAPRGGALDAGAPRAKAFFVAAQALYTLAALAAAAAAFHSFAAHTALLAAVGLCTVWNGAGFYVRVFSRTYMDEAAEKVAEAVEAEAAARRRAAAAGGGARG